MNDSNDSLDRTIKILQFNAILDALGWCVKELSHHCAIPDEILDVYEYAIKKRDVPKEPEWQPIETAPKGNIWFDVLAVSDSPEQIQVTIEECRYERWFGVWRLRGKQNFVSLYLKPTHWRKRQQQSAEDTAP